MDFEGGHGSTGHPVLDSGNVQDDLSLEVNAVSRTPYTDVFDISTEDVFSVRGDDDPPVSKRKVPERVVFSAVVLKPD